jgi:hypothetical protein
MDLCDGSDIALCQDVRCIASTNGAREVKALQPIALSIWRSAIGREIRKTRTRAVWTKIVFNSVPWRR